MFIRVNAGFLVRLHESYLFTSAGSASPPAPHSGTCLPSRASGGQPLRAVPPGRESSPAGVCPALRPARHPIPRSATRPSAHNLLVSAAVAMFCEIQISRPQVRGAYHLAEPQPGYPFRGRTRRQTPRSRRSAVTIRQRNFALVAELPEFIHTFRTASSRSMNVSGLSGIAAGVDLVGAIRFSWASYPPPHHLTVNNSL